VTEGRRRISSPSLVLRKDGMQAPEQKWVAAAQDVLPNLARHRFARLRPLKIQKSAKQRDLAETQVVKGRSFRDSDALSERLQALLWLTLLPQN
jgi:hypothetical protein